MIQVWKVKRLKPPPSFSVGFFCLFVYLFVCFSGVFLAGCECII